MTIITIIRGHVPHLIANMTYIKEFTFQQNLEIGKYGFAISTFDAVIQYILESRTELASLSDRNNKLWISIRQGDINDVQSILPDKKNSNNSGNSDTLPSDYRASHRFAENSARCFSLFPTADLLHVRDPLGNTPLLIAAGAGWAAVVDYLLLLDPDSAGVANNAGQTALMRACQSGSVDTVKRLLVDASCCLAAQDDKGYTAFLHANHRGQGPLHLATTADALEYLIQRLPSDILPWQDYEGKTFLHVQKKHPIDSNTMASLLSIRDYYGQTPLLAWATNGWFDNIEAVLWFAEDRNLYAHNRGQTILHAMATALDPSRPQVTTLSPCTIENIVRRLAWLVDVREWANGNTVLHLAANLRLTDCNRPFVFSFIRSLLIHAGARIESTNERGVRAVNASRDPDMIAFLTEMIIEAHRHGDSNMVASLSINDADTGRDTLHCYNFRVTGASALHTTIQYTIASVPAHSVRIHSPCDHPPKPNLSALLTAHGPLAWKQELKTINRTLQDFYQLRQDIVRECPELFLPTLRHLVDPEQVGLQPEPPVCLQEEAVRQLDGFMQWLESHPTLRDHDLVQTFVRSQTLEREMIENASFARRDLLLEAIGKFPLAGNDFGGSEDEEYFFSFSQHQIETLREALTGILRAGRRVAQCRQDLEAVASQIGQLLDRCNDYCDEKKRDRKGDKVVAGSDPRRLCIAMTGDTAYGSSPLDDLVRGFQMMRDLIDGILMALQHPLWLLHRRIELREHLEHERDHLRRVKSWNEVFSTQRQQVEQTQNNVSKTLSDLARTGRQIARSHQMISDEMAHFQRVHPVQLKDMMKSYCRTQLLQERLRLLWLQEQANELMSRRSGH
ncbi:ankyrin repeat-containing domain protein [Dichotomocladium elegans]|nr:ankyrin repeat-containing domain protein [Dichotomocladium elegans]